MPLIGVVHFSLSHIIVQVVGRTSVPHKTLSLAQELLIVVVCLTALANRSWMWCVVVPVDVLVCIAFVLLIFLLFLVLIEIYYLEEGRVPSYNTFSSSCLYLWTIVLVVFGVNSFNPDFL